MSNSTRLSPLLIILAAATLIVVTLLLTPAERIQSHLDSLSVCTGIGASSDYRFAYTPSAVNARLNVAESAWEHSVALRTAFFAERGGSEHFALLGDGGGTFSVWDCFTPSFPCPYVDERLGRMGDGGKWICGLDTMKESKFPVVLSIGVERESSFEAEVIDRHPEVMIYGYDLSVEDWGPQIQASDFYRQRTKFAKIGISAKDEPDKIPPNQSLKTMMQSRGVDYIDIFKIDVEGGEWDILPQIIADFYPEPLPFGQMQIELHVNDPNTTMRTVEQFFQGIERAGLRAFHQELNMPTTPYSGMYYCEYSYVNTKHPLSPFYIAPK